MKRFVCIFLILCLTLPLCLGCMPMRSGRDVCLSFLECISEGRYTDAYALVDDAVKQTDDDENNELKGRISEKQFVAKYTNIFDALEIESVLYENIGISEGDVFTIAHFTGTYSSPLLGEVSEEFKMVVLKTSDGWRVEWAPDLIFSDMEWGDTIRVAKLSADRGEIIADGEMLATTEGKISVYAIPANIPEENLEWFRTRCTALLGLTDEELEKKLASAYDGVAILKQYYTGTFPEYLETQLLEIEGVGIDYGNYGQVRSYPQGKTLAHTLGYVGIINASSTEELNEKIDALNEGRTEDDGLYNTDSYVGRNGLEAQYERELRGKDGYRIYICTSSGTNRRTLYTQEPQDGYDLQLTINFDLQKRLEFVLDSVLYGETTAGAVIVMNPTTGAVEAMQSWPSYDLNEFAQGISSASYNKLLNMANTPLYNRLTQGLYPPGSVLKAFTAVAALETGTLDENYVFEGEIEDDYWLPTEFGTWTGSKIKRTEVKYGRMSPLNMRSAIVHSDNIYFANASLLLGWENFQSYMEAIGFGEAVPFDLNVASSQLYNEGTELSLMLLAESGYGQGEILMTPLQLASIFCAFANGGNIMVPYIVDGLYETEGITYNQVSRTMPRVWKSGVVQQPTLDIVVPYLQDVVNRDLNGTGRSLRVTSVQVAAKTGTAEIGNDKSREISWFAGFRTGVSDEDARLVLVMLEIPAEEEFTSLKFDIARELLKMSAP